MTETELLAHQLEGTRDWTLKLLKDVKGDDWSFQPREGLAHLLWLCGHFATAQDTLVHARCFDKSVMDPSFKKHFAHGAPIRSAADYDYPPAQDILEVMADVHTKTCQVVRGMSASLLAEPAYGPDGKTPHPHYRDKRGAVSHCALHEAFHAGQIATVRALLGKTFLR